ALVGAQLAARLVDPHYRPRLLTDRWLVADALPRLKAALADHYTIERELGRGGMATVYLARDLKHGRLVAVKVLRPELAAALGPDRFLREIEIAARLTHPHILPLYESGEADGVLYYVMPYVEGESLRDRLDRERQLPLDDSLRIAGEVASALAYAHGHDGVHRDIKPENILLAGGGAFVADFGIARAITAAAGERLTATGIAVGTPAYMSPEQAAGDRALDGRTDVYSLGCVLYEMLAGQAPFTGPSTVTIVHQHLTAPPPSVTRIRPAVPATVARVIERALAKAPADRFASAHQFAEALAAAVRDALQGGDQAAPRDRAGAARRRARRGLGHLCGGARAGDRAADRCRDRPARVGGDVRSPFGGCARAAERGSPRRGARNPSHAHAGGAGTPACGAPGEPRRLPGLSPGSLLLVPAHPGGAGEGLSAFPAGDQAGPALRRRVRRHRRLLQRPPVL